VGSEAWSKVKKDWVDLESEPIKIRKEWLAASFLKSKKGGDQMVRRRNRMRPFVSALMGHLGSDDAIDDADPQFILEIVDAAAGVLVPGHRSRRGVSLDRNVAIGFLVQSMEAVRTDGTEWTKEKNKNEGIRTFRRFWASLDSEVTVRRHPDFEAEQMLRVDVLKCDAFRVSDTYQDIMATTYKPTSNMSGKGFIQYKELPDWKLGGDDCLTMAMKCLIFDVMKQHGPMHGRISPEQDYIVPPEAEGFMMISQLRSTIQEKKNDVFLSRQDPHRDYKREYLKGFNDRVKQKLGVESKGPYYPWSFDMPLTKAGMQLSAFVVSETADNRTTFSERRLTLEMGSILLWRGDLVHAGGYPAPANIDDPAARVHGHVPVYNVRGGVISPDKERVSIDCDHKGRKMAPMAFDEMGRPWLYGGNANGIARHRDDNGKPAFEMGHGLDVSYRSDQRK
jgi:hypothetical protein